METEDKILRQQVLNPQPVKSMSEHLSIPVTPERQVFLLACSSYYIEMCREEDGPLFHSVLLC
jgi:hypothetical protein